MDSVVDFCLSLSLAPVPGLKPLIDLLRGIWDTVQNIQASKARMKNLAVCVAELLVALHEAMEGGVVRMKDAQARIDGLERFLAFSTRFLRD